MEVPQKTKSTAVISSRIPTPGHTLRQKYNSKGCMHPMFIAALFTVTKTWKQPTRLSTDEGIKKM